jgi:hypothetical protein
MEELMFGDLRRREYDFYDPREVDLLGDLLMR